MIVSILCADSMMTNPGGRAGYNFDWLNLAPRVESFQPFLIRARGLELEKISTIFAQEQLIELRSVESQAAGLSSLAQIIIRGVKMSSEDSQDSSGLS